MSPAVGRALLLSLVGATAGCVEVEPSVIVNETDAPVRIRYALPFFTVAVGTTPICPLLGEPPKVKANSGHLRLPDGWMPAPGLEVDTEECEASFVLEPSVAAMLYRNGYCDDYEKHADQGAAFRPSLEYLVTEIRGGARESRGWEAVAQFKRAWWSDWCFLRIRESY
jgi:hypothetical protein